MNALSWIYSIIAALLLASSCVATCQHRWLVAILTLVVACMSYRFATRIR